MQESSGSPTHLRWLLLVGALLNFLAGVQLFVLGDQSLRWFAWTLTPAAGGGALGAFSWAAAATLLLAWAEHAWSGVRALVPGGFAFAALALAASVAGFGHLHWLAPAAGGVITAAWLLSVSLAIPAWILIALLNEEHWRDDPHPGRHHSLPLLLIVAFLTAVALVIGSLLFVAGAGRVWPWPLDRLTAQVTGAWLVAAGVTGLAILVERGSARTRAPFAGLALVGALLLLALLRFHTAPAHPLRLVGYVAAALMAVAAGYAGLRRGLTDPRPSAAPFVR